jgi:hypothetical protein
MTTLGQITPVQRPGARVMPQFRKVLPHAGAEAEARGWSAVAGHLAVPRFLGCTWLTRHGIVSYEHVFDSGTCKLLLGDVLGEADRDPSKVPVVEVLIDSICRDLCTAAERTGRPGRLAECVPALYADRLRPGGRLDQWYLSPGRASCLAMAGTAIDAPVDLRDLSGYELRVNGRNLRFDLARAVAGIRDDLAPDSRWLTALTQGDPTEPNIAAPLCWLDFEHAGRNTLAGEAANLLWYLLGMGGWLVPRYQPDVYARTMRLVLAPVVTPVIDHMDASTRHHHVEISYTWAAGPGRHAAIRRLAGWLQGDLATALGCTPSGVHALLRPFLLVRMLGVIPVSHLTSADAFLILAKLAQNSDPGTSLGEFACTAKSATTEGA